MKKLLTILLALVLVFSLAACGGGITVFQDDNGANDSSPAENIKTNYSLNETASTSLYNITANELKESKGDSFFEPEEGNTFVGINFTVENISGESQTFSSLLSFTAYVDGVKCDYSFNAACAFSDGTLDGDVAAGKKLIGWHALEVPENWKELEVQFTPEILSSETITFKFTK